jgi:hypothetical protein
MRARAPAGGATQGPDESNADSDRVGAGPPNRWLIPMKLRAARQGLPCGRLPADWFVVYLEASRRAQRSIEDGLACRSSLR